MFMTALKGGKNIYIEKPLAHDIEQGEEILQAAEKSGKGCWYRNSLEDNPAWRYKVPDDANPQNSELE
jgi:hypothetical protein